MPLDLLHQSSVTAVQDLIKMVDVQWISWMDYSTDDMCLDFKVDGDNGLVLDQCCVVRLQW